MEYNTRDPYDVGITTEFQAKKLIIDQKLNVALRDSTIVLAKRALLLTSDPITSTADERFVYHLKHNNLVNHEDIKSNYHIYPVIMTRMFSYRDEYKCLNNTTNNLIKPIMQTIRKVAQFSLDFIMGSLKDIKFDKTNYIEDTISALPPHRMNVLRRLVSMYHIVDHWVNNCMSLDNISQKTSTWDELIKSRTITCHHLNWITYVGNDIVIIDMKGEQYLLPKQYLNLIHNKLCDFISVYVYMLFANELVYGEGSFHQFERFYNYWFRLAANLQQDFFPIAKSLESIVIGENIIEADGPSNSAFMIGLTDSLLTECKFDYYASTLMDILQSVNGPLRNELGCLSKIAGHPFVDINEGIKSMLKKARDEKDLDYTVIAETSYMAKQIFICNYYNKYKEWPPCTFAPGTPDVIRTAYNNKLHPKAHVLASRQQITLNMYSYVTVSQCQEFELYSDVNALIKDKTITQTAKDVLRQAEGEKISASEYYKKTRLLLSHFMDSKGMTRHDEYHQRIYDMRGNERWELLKDYNVMRIVPKEKELKIAFRGFGCQTIENRIQHLKEEYNVATLEELFCHEQAMTCTELEISRKLVIMRNLAAKYKGYKAISISIDASSWCSGWRNLACKPILTLLDDIFDTEHFTYVQEYYEHLIYYLADKDSTHLWYGQYGGIEGLNQYTWVFIYLAQVHAAMAKLPYLYHVLCKGDDLRIVVLIPETYLSQISIEELRVGILSHVSGYLEKVGHKIKMDDSYASLNFLAFSKNASIHQAELGQVFRKIQKTYGASNSTLQNVDNYISASFSNAHSSSRVGVNPLPCYLTGLFWSSLYIQRDSKYKTLPEAAKVAMLLTPSMLGGPPIIYLHNFLVRTESDMLSPFIEYVQFAEVHYPEVYTYLERFLLLTPTDENKLESLCRDSYMIYVKDKPSLPESILREKLSSVIKRKSQNPLIKELFSTNLDEEKKNLMSVLETADMYDARMLSFMFSKSVFGYRAELLKKWESGQSMFRYIASFDYRTAKSLLLKCAKADKRLKLWRYNKLMGLEDKKHTYSWMYWRTLSKQNCPAEIAYNIRKIMYGKEVIGVTMPCMRHFITIKEESPNAKITEHDIRNHFVMSYGYEQSKITPLKNYSWDFQPGTYSPLIGAVTPSGNSIPIRKIQSAEPAAHKASALLTGISWSTGVKPPYTYPSNCYKIFVKLFSQYSRADPRELSEYIGQRMAGTSAHHQPGGNFDARVSANVLSNNATKFSGNPSSHTIITNSNDKYYINFVQIYIHSFMMISLVKQIQPEYNICEKYWLITPECTFCMRPLKHEDELMYFDDDTLDGFQPDQLTNIKTIMSTDELYRQLATSELANPTIIPRNTTALSRQEAIVGLMQNFLDAHFYPMMELRYTEGGANLNQEGYRDIMYMRGLTSEKSNFTITELKKMNTVELFEALCDFIQSWAWWHYKGLVNTELEIAIEQKPIAELPWYPLYQIMNKAGIWLTFLDELEDQYGFTFRKDAVSGFSQVQMIGVHCLKHMKNTNNNITFVRLASSPDPQVVKHLITKIRRHYISSINTAYHSHTGGVFIINADAIPNYDIIIRNLYLISRDVTLTEFSTERRISARLIYIYIRLFCEIFLDYLEENWTTLTDHPLLNTANRPSHEHGNIPILLGHNVTLDAAYVNMICNNMFNFFEQKLEATGLPLNPNRYTQEVVDRHDGWRLYHAAYNTYIIINFIDIIDMYDQLQSLFVHYVTLDLISIRLVYTDIVNCKNSIRLEPNYWHRQRHHAIGEDEELMGDLNVSKFRFGRLVPGRLTNYQFNPNSVRDVPAVLQPLNSLTRVKNSPIVYHTQRSYGKVFGLATGSMTYLLESLEKHRIQQTQYGQALGIVIGDGLGGTLWCLSELTRSSKFHYITLRDNDEGEFAMYPEVIKSINTHKHRLIIDYTTLYGGDITSRFIHSKLEGIDAESVTVITCDASFHNNDQSKFIEVLNECLFHYFRAMTGCFLYIRVYSNELMTHTGISILAQFNMISKDLYLEKPQASNNPYEFYLFGIRNDHRDPLNAKTLTDVEIYKMYKFFDVEIQEYNKEVMKSDRVVHIAMVAEYPETLKPPGSFLKPLCKELMHLDLTPNVAQSTPEYYRTIMNRKLALEQHLDNSTIRVTRDIKAKSLGDKIRFINDLLLLEGILVGLTSAQFAERDELINCARYSRHYLHMSNINIDNKEIPDNLGTYYESLGKDETKFYISYLKGIRYGARIRNYYASLGEEIIDRGEE